MCSIIIAILIFGVLTAVGFNDQAFFNTTEVDEKWSQRELPSEFISSKPSIS
jgi:hypothetical protein